MICTPAFVQELVKRDLPGLPLAHLKACPAAILKTFRTQYFEIARTGPCWSNMTKVREVGIYLPAEMPQPEVELSALLDR